MEALCSKCGKNPSALNSYGYRIPCKPCRSAGHAAWAAGNIEKIRANYAKWKANNPGRPKQIHDAWKARNPGRARDNHAAWTSANPSKVKAATEKAREAERLWSKRILADLKRARAAPPFTPHKLHLLAPNGLNPVELEPMPTLLESLGVTALAAPGTHDDREIRGAPVGKSKDLTRIHALPRRALDVKDPRAAAAWTEHLRLERTTPCDCKSRWPNGCITEFNPVQGWALEEAMDVGGMLGSIAVGGGKTGIGIFLPMAIPNVSVAVLLVPAGLKTQLLARDYPQWSQHFKVPNLAGHGAFVPKRPMLHVLSYNEISNPKNSDLFKTLGPIDLVIDDECHNLADPKTARTRRFHRIWDLNPKAKNASYSGTLTKKSPVDYAHLAGLALGDGSPLPHEHPVVEEWATLIGASPFVAPIGAFQILMKPNESARAAFGRRLVETKGVIATGENEFGVSLTINERKPGPVPADVAAALGTAQGGERPDGEELVEALQVETVSRQVAAGFFYRWKFIHGETEDQVTEWLKHRKAFFKELRTELYKARENYDSPKLLQKAATRWHDGYWFTEYRGHRHTDACYERHDEGDDEDDAKAAAADFGADDGEPVCGLEQVEGAKVWIEPKTKKGPLPVFPSEHWPAWRAIAKTVKPITVPVWINDYLVKDAAAWLLDKKNDPGIAWFEFTEFGRAVAEMAGVPYYGGGKLASDTIILEKGDRPIVASIKAHGTGKNLQYAFSRNLVMNPPSDGACWEQLIGRTHRPGQPYDEVTVDLYRHTERWMKAFNTARDRAAYIQSNTQSQQKLCVATYGFDPDADGFERVTITPAAGAHWSNGR